MTGPSITVTPAPDPDLHITWVVGESEADGWTLTFATTGNLLTLSAHKDGERPVHESIDLTDLYGQWWEIALARRDSGEEKLE